MQWHQLDNMQTIGTWLQRDNHANTSSLLCAATTSNQRMLMKGRIAPALVGRIFALRACNAA